MTEQTATVAATDEVAAAVLAAQMKIIDAAVREARTQGWCGEFERIMGRLFPDGPPDGSAHFVDSDGLSCRGLDRDGYNRRGFDAEGYDREGFAQDGHDREGYNREGYDYQGYDRDGFNAAGVDREGWSRDGWNADRTVNRDSEEYRTRYQYDGRGYPATVYGYHHASGLNSRGYTREQQERQDRQNYRFDTEGYDVGGRNRYGYTREQVARGYDH